MSRWTRNVLVLTILAICGWSGQLLGAEIVENPFVGITHITRVETSPRNVTMHIVKVDLTAPGIRFLLTPPGGTRETVRQTTLDFLNQVNAQVAINSHFFLPFPSTDTDAFLIGLAASNGNVYSAFETPVQCYAIVTNVPGVNIDPCNQSSIVHYDDRFADGKHVLEDVTLWNALAGSAQIITNGVKTIPTYRDAQNPDALLCLGGSAPYSNSDSWYNRIRARTAVGLSQDNRTLFLFTVDETPAAVSGGMTGGEVADVLINDYGVYNALNLDGGGSTTLVMEDPITGDGVIKNMPSDGGVGRSDGSNLAVFAAPITAPPPPQPACSRTNVALSTNGSTVLASSTDSSKHPADAAINGDRTGQSWSTADGGWNDGTRAVFPDTLEVDFQTQKIIDEINVFTLQNNWKTAGLPDLNTPATGEGIVDFRVQTCNLQSCSEDDWVTVPGGVVGGNDKAWQQFTFPPTAAWKIRVLVNMSRNNFSRIVELEAFGFPML